MLKMLPALPMLRMLPELPMLKMLPLLATLSKLPALKSEYTHSALPTLPKLMNDQSESADHFLP